MAQLARVATNIASNNRRVFVIGVGMTKVKYNILKERILSSDCYYDTIFIDFEKIISLFSYIQQFEKPGRRDNFDYPDMAHEAVSKALKDAKIEYSQIKQAAVGYVYGTLNKFRNYKWYI